MNPFRRFHAWVDKAQWSRPGLERLASATRRVKLRAIADHVRPVPAAPSDQLVSVIIPSYNYARFLPGAVTSVLEQEGVNVEVIVVDDASTDDTGLVVSRMTDPRIRLLANDSNSGHVQTFNNGLAVAKGDFIVRLDADDLLVPGALGRAVQLFNSYPNVGLVYGYPRHFDTPEPPPALVGNVTFSVWEGTDWVLERCRRGVNCITTPEAMLRASVVEQVGPLNTGLKFAQDMEMWLRVAAVSDVGRVNGADQALHRDHPDSMSVIDAAGELTDIQERRLVFEHFFNSTGGQLAEANLLESTAKKSLANEALSQAVFLYDRGRYKAELVDSLVVFAQDLHPDYRNLRSWRALQRRRMVGPTILSLDPSAFVRLAITRSRSELDYLEWTVAGL